MEYTLPSGEHPVKAKIARINNALVETEHRSLC
jgi:hypothetical protein